MVEVGVQLLADAPVPHIVELAREAERLGFSKCWIFDEGLSTRDAFVTLGAIAQNSSTLQIGTGITNPYSRHPAQTANAIATVDEISGGRAFLGIGAGGSLVLDPMGLKRNKPLVALREIFDTFRPLFRGDKVTYQGEVIQLKEAHLDFARSNLPIWIASRGPKILSLAGQAADGVILEYSHPNIMQNNINMVAGGAAKSGNAPKLCCTVKIATDDRMLEKYRPYLTFAIVDSPLEVKEMIGISPAEVEVIRQTMFRDGLVEAGKLLKEAWLKPFVLMGSPAECARELKSMTERFGIDEISINNMDLETVPQLMQQVAEIISMW